VGHAVVAGRHGAVVRVVEALGVEQDRPAAGKLPGRPSIKQHGNAGCDAQPELIGDLYVLDSLERIFLEDELHVALDPLTIRGVQLLIQGHVCPEPPPMLCGQSLSGQAPPSPRPPEPNEENQDDGHEPEHRSHHGDFVPDHAHASPDDESEKPRRNHRRTSGDAHEAISV
jgi:hypothetical protein